MTYVIWISLALLTVWLAVKVISALFSFLAAVAVPVVILFGIAAGAKVYLDARRRDAGIGTEKTDRIEG